MRQGGVVAPAVQRMAKRYGPKTIKPEVVVTIERPQQA